LLSLGGRIHSPDRLFLAAASLLAVLVLVMQGAGGAWTAEFNGYPDEAAHFVTGKMLRDYVGSRTVGTWH
jgi:hypothetical protein